MPSEGERAIPGALDDLRIVEIGSDAAFCGRLFADFGAEVIKIEPPGGDPFRQVGGLFAFLNAGKRSLVLDLNTGPAKAALNDLLSEADILIMSLDCKEMEVWDLVAERVLRNHPDLVVVGLTPFGLTGEWAGRPGGDLESAAFSSLAFGLGEPGKAPLRLPFDQSQYQGALHAAAAALCALRARDLGLGGQIVDVATSQVMAYCTGGMYLVTVKAGVEWGRRGRLLRGVYPTGFFECADGYICIASQSPKQWEKFLKIMGEPDWAQEPQARNAMVLGAVDPSPVDEHFRKWLRGFTRAELTRLAMEEGITLGQVNTVDELLAEPHFQDRDLWFSVEVDDSRIRIPRPGYLMSETPARLGTRPPELNEASTVAAFEPRTRPPASVRSESSRGALEGIRVVEFGWNWAGPMAGQLLADMGAEVIRVETVKRQDVMRLLPYMSAFFCNANRSKLSVSINLATDGGPDLVRRLVGKSDMILDNFAAGVMARNGLGYSDLLAVREDIICVSMSMAGQEGPLSGMRGFASIATGFAGLERMVGYIGEDPIGLMAFGLGDTNLAIQGVLAALAALRYRDRTGAGQFVDVSQIECSIGTLGEPIINYQLTGEIAGPQGNGHSIYFPHGIYRTLGDDQWLVLSVRCHRDWEGLCRLLNRPDWAELDRDARLQCKDQIDRTIEEWARNRERDVAIDELVDAGVRCAPVLTRPERDSHPHYLERNLTIQHRAKGFDDTHIYSTPWILSETPPKMRRPTPLLGEHNDYVFGEILQMTPEEIRKLSEDGVIS